MVLPIPYGTSLFVPPTPTPPDRREYVGQNNQILSARLIDPATQDYVINTANGQFKGMDVVQQQVYLSLITVFDTSAQNGLGNKLLQIKLVTPNIIQQCTSACQQALSTLLNNGSVILNAVNVVINGPGQIIVQVIWTENSTTTQQTTNLPLSS
jgi:phage gp46-like protein